MIFALLCLFLVLLTLAYLDTRKPKRFPPGPKWLPIVGSALEFGYLHRKLGTLSRTAHEFAIQHGPLVGLRIVRRNVVLVDGPELLREFYTREELNGRLDDLSATSRTWGKRLGIFFNDSEQLEQQRSFALQQLKRCGYRKQDMEANISQEVSGIIGDIKERLSKSAVVRMDDLFEPHVLGTVWLLLSGGRRALSKEEVKEFRSAMNNFAQNMSPVGYLFNYFPFLINLCPNLCGYSTYVDVHERITTFLRKQLNVLKKNYDPDNRQGLIEEYLYMLSTSERIMGSSEDQLLAICLDLTIGNFETTCSLVNVALVYLLLNPKVQKKAQEEIDRVVGRDKLPTLEDKPRLQYVNCLVLEVCRLFMGRSLAAPRRALKDVTLNGYIIPKDTILLGNFWGLFVNENLGWESPQAFRPERFIQDGLTVIPEILILFGLGKRRCIGEPMGRTNLFLIIASVLHQFDFKAQPDEPPSTDFVEGFVPHVKPFKAVVTLR